MSTFDALRAANRARQQEWDKDDRIGSVYRGNEMAGEIGEALERAVAVILMGAAGGRASNVIKKLERERLGIRGSRATVTDLAEELADVVICADLIAMAEGIDLDAAVVAKFNATSEKVGLKTRMPERLVRGVALRPGARMLKARAPDRPELDALIEQSVAWFNALSPEEQEAHLRSQRESLARGLAPMERETTT